MRLLHAKGGGTGSGRVRSRPLQPDLLEDLYEYWLLVETWWRTVLIATAVVTTAVLLLTVMFARRSYQAVALIEPATQPSLPELMLMGGGDSGLARSLAGSLLANSNPNLFGENPLDEEYKAITHSFEFVTGLMTDERIRKAAISDKPDRLTSLLEPVVDRLRELLPHAPASPGLPLENWSLYRQVDGRFDSRYDVQTGMMTLSFVSHNPADAKTVLQAYIQRLRQILAKSRVAQSKQALTSLEREIAHTSDNRLREQLYKVAAEEIAQQTAAEAEADYAFKVLSGPVVDLERPYRPRPVLYCVVSGFLTAILLSLLVLISHRIAYFKTEFERLASSAGEEHSGNGRPPGGREEQPPTAGENRLKVTPVEWPR